MLTIGGDKKMKRFKLNLHFKKTKKTFSDLEIQNAYRKNYTTKRLKLEKIDNSDGIYVIFKLFERKLGKKIGEVIFMCDGEIFGSIEEKVRGQGYIEEAIFKLIKVSRRNEFYSSIKENNISAQRVAEKLGFVKESEETWKYRK